MAVLRHTSANIEFMKRQLRQDYPEIGSAHRTEAFAAACGFRTRASQLAALRRSVTRPEAIAVDGQGWIARLAKLGYGFVQDDRMIVSLHSQLLPNPCSAMVSARDRALGERWFKQCKSANLPYITIEPARKYATLEWDCITLDTSCEDAIREDEGRGIVNGLFAAFQRHSAGSGAKPYFFGSAFVGSIKGLKPDIAQILADEFFMALYLASSRSPHQRREM